MANALIGGMLGQGFDANKVCATDPYQPSLEALQQQFGVHAAQSNEAAMAWADVVVLAVKPQILKAVMSELSAPYAEAEQQPLFVSIAAGISTASIVNWLEHPAAVVRCMPNTPALLRLGATGLWANALVTDAQKQLAETIMTAVGICAWVENEPLLDAVTAVSGSGPAYFFAIMEAMQKIGMEMGLTEAMATEFVQQTALGAARMAQDSDVDVAELRRRVSSPGGTTLAALDALETGGLQQLLGTALEAARARADEMGNELGA